MQSRSAIPYIDSLTTHTLLNLECLWSMYLRLTGSQTYGAFLRYALGQNAETGRDRSITAGLNGSYIITARTRIQGTAQVDEYFDRTSAANIHSP